jgi:AraC-like DNA-binding protein
MDMVSSPFYFQQPFCQMATGCRVVELDPPADLAPFVAKLGFVKINQGYVRQRVPDGCFSVCVGMNAERGLVRSFVFTPDLNWGHWPVEAGWTYVEARLRWGAGAPFLHFSREDLTNRQPTDEVFGKGWRGVMGRMYEAKSPDARLAVFVEALRGLAPDPIRSDIARSTRLLERFRPEMRVDDLADAACLSSSQLRRIFANEVGASPKDMLRLSRLWWSMRMAIEKPLSSWGTIAAESGFADQAHLIDEYRHFTGATPTQWHRNLFGIGSLSVAPRRLASLR